MARIWSVPALLAERQPWVRLLRQLGTTATVPAAAAALAATPTAPDAASQLPAKQVVRERLDGCFCTE